MRHYRHFLGVSLGSLMSLYSCSMHFCSFNFKLSDEKLSCHLGFRWKYRTKSAQYNGQKTDASSWMQVWL